MPLATLGTLDMLPEIERNRVRIAELCRQFRVRRLELFGSALGSHFDPTRSDVDFLVEFEPMPSGAYAESHFSLREGLEALLGRPVDLVTVRSLANPFLKASIDASRREMYAA